MADQISRGGKPERFLAVIVLDMVGDRDLSVTLPRNSDPHLLSLAFDAARAENARQYFALARTGILDDHVPFQRLGIPAIDIIDFEFGTQPGANDLWHTAGDTLDTIAPESLQTVGRVVLRMVDMLVQEYTTGN